MSNALKKTWPYLLALSILAVVAIFTEDYLPVDWFKETPRVSVEDTVTYHTDTSDVRVDLQTDTVGVNVVIEDSLEQSVLTLDKKWSLVVASLPNKEQAEVVAAKLEVGVSEVRYVDYLDTYRVVYGRYSSLLEAQQAFEAVSAQYPSAWLVYF